MTPALLRLAEGPTVEPVTLDEAKMQCRVRNDREDDYITALIVVAREWAESYTKRSFIEQQWTAGYTGWPCDGVFELARPPVISVESLNYRDVNDTLATTDAANYQTEFLSFPGEVKLKCGYARPTLQTDRLYPVTVEFTTGYGETSDDVPGKIKQAILMMVHHFYDNRVPAVIGTISTKIPLSVESLLSTLRKFNI